MPSEAVRASTPTSQEATRLENVKRWVEADESGYADLIEAVRWRGS